MLAAQDPGHARLAVAIAATVGTLASAAFGQFVIHEFHGNASLLTVSLFLSVLAASMVKGPTAQARGLTVALMLPVTVLVTVFVTMLSDHRWLVTAGFVLATGLAIWMRRFGPRATALGAIGFMAYFFTLLMKPTHNELVTLCLVTAGAIAAQVAARAVLMLMLKRPARELEVLLNELRAGSRAAVQVSGHPLGAGKDRELRDALARLDNVGRAITSWQRSFDTGRYVAINEARLAELVLDARVDTEEACLERAQTWAAKGTPASATAVADKSDEAERALYTVLDARSAPAQMRDARDVSEQLVRQGETRDLSLASYLLARSAVSHARLRAVKFSHGHARGSAASPATADSVHGDSSHAPPPARAVRTRRRSLPRRDWAPTSRMAVQAMIAALIATGVGELISASRWYWAVLTAFLIFVGGNSRSGVFTRAYRRVAGTGVGLAIGIAAVALSGSHEPAVVGVCVIAVFGMLYFGPLSYFYAAMFVSVLLVALFRLLGVLDSSVLELRLVETLSGAVIGVLCAYLIVSATSRPALLGSVDAYFNALDRLLRAVRDQRFTDQTEPMRLLRAVESAQANLDQDVTAMSAAFAVGSPHRESEAVHLMFDASRASARLVQAVLASQGTPSTDGPRVSVLEDAVDHVLEASAVARRTLHGEDAKLGDGSVGQNAPVALVVDQLRGVPQGNTATRDALLALGRIHWALRQLIGRRERESKKNPHSGVPSGGHMVGPAGIEPTTSTV